MSESGLIDDSNSSRTPDHIERMKRDAHRTQGVSKESSQSVQLKEPSGFHSSLTWPQPTHHRGPLEEQRVEGH